jgi:hypothetical protein
MTLTHDDIRLLSRHREQKLHEQGVDKESYKFRSSLACEQNRLKDLAHRLSRKQPSVSTCP